MSEPLGRGSPNAPLDAVKAGLIHQLITGLGLQRLGINLQYAIKEELSDKPDVLKSAEFTIAYFMDMHNAKHNQRMYDGNDDDSFNIENYNFKTRPEEQSKSAFIQELVNEFCKAVKTDMPLFFEFLHFLRITTRSVINEDKESARATHPRDLHNNFNPREEIWFPEQSLQSMDGGSSVKNAATKAARKTRDGAAAIVTGVVNAVKNTKNYRTRTTEETAVSDSLNNEAQEAVPSSVVYTTTPDPNYIEIDKYLTSVERLIGGICWNDFPFGLEAGYYIPKTSSGYILKRQYYKYRCALYPYRPFNLDQSTIVGQVREMFRSKDYFPEALGMFRVAPDSSANNDFGAAYTLFETLNPQNPDGSPKKNPYRQFDYWQMDLVEKIRTLQTNGYGTSNRILYGLHAAPAVQYIHSMGGLITKKTSVGEPRSVYSLKTTDLRSTMKEYFIKCFVTSIYELDLFMLGHALHMIEDSFSPSHVERSVEETLTMNANTLPSGDDIWERMLDHKIPNDINLVLRKYLNYTNQSKHGHGDVEDFNSVFTSVTSKENKSQIDTNGNEYLVPVPDAFSYKPFVMATQAAYMVFKYFFLCLFATAYRPYGYFTRDQNILAQKMAGEVFEKIYTNSTIKAPESEVTVADCGGVEVCEPKKPAEEVSMDDVNVDADDKNQTNKRKFGSGGPARKKPRT
jgi:hypothetical protein